MDNLAMAPMRILCFGDSNTYGFDPCACFGGRYPAQTRWVDLLAQRTGWEVHNAGENGRCIPRREGELRRFTQMLSECRPLDLLIVMLGTNDLLQDTDPEETAARMEALLSQAPLDRDQILLIAPPPMALGAWVESEALVAASVQLADAFQALARRLGVRFADAAAWHVELTYDGVHFSESGHRAFAEGLCRTLGQT